jgi:hypothetical protein
MDAAASGPGTLALDGSNPATFLGNPAGLLYTSDGTVYVANNASDTLTAYTQPPGLSAVEPTPRQLITLPADVDETQSVTRDARGNLYVGAFSGGVLVYPPGATGSASPTRRLTGPTSGAGTTQVVIGSDRSLTVGQYGGPRVATFAALVPLEPPGAPTALKVAGKKKDRKRTITWTPGAALDAPITSYTLTVTKGSKTRVSVTTGQPTYTLKAKKLKKSGSYTVTVVAISATGRSDPASATFTVKLKKKHHHRG